MPLDSLAVHDDKGGAALLPFLFAAGLDAVGAARTVTADHAYPAMEAITLTGALVTLFHLDAAGVGAALQATNRYSQAEIDSALASLGPPPGPSTCFVGFAGATPLARFGADGAGRPLDVFTAPGCWQMTADLTRDKLYYLVNGPTGCGIHRMNYDGSGHETVLGGINSGVLNLAIDPAEGAIFWSAYQGPIQRCDLQGGGAGALVGDYWSLSGLGVDPVARRLFWRSGEPPNGDRNASGAGHDWKIRSAAYDGSDVRELCDLDDDALAWAITVDPTRRYLYFLSWRGLARIPLSGGAMEYVHSPGSTVGGGGLCFLPGTDRIAWVNATDGILYTVNADGSDPQTLVRGLDQAASLAAAPSARVPAVDPSPPPPAPADNAGYLFDGRHALVLEKNNTDQIAYRDATGGYGRSPNDLVDVSGSGFAFQALIRPTDLAGQHPLASSRGPVDNLADGGRWVLPGTTDVGSRISLVDGFLVFEQIGAIWFQGMATGERPFSLRASKPVAAGVWSLVTVVVAYGETVTFYLNGEKVAEGQGSAQPQTSTRWTFASDGAAGFLGQALWFGLWKGDRSAADILATPARLFSPSEVALWQAHGLGGYWPLDAVSGDRAPDLTAVANTADVVILPPPPPPPSPPPPPVSSGAWLSTDGGGFGWVPPNPAFNFGAGDFSVAARFSTTRPGTLVSRKSTEGGSPSYAGWLLVLGPGGSIKFATDNGYGFNELRTVATNALDGGMHCVVAVRQGGQLIVYLDGQAIPGTQGGNAGSPLDVSSGLPLYIASAQQEQEPYRMFVGQIGPVALWSRALAQGEAGGWPQATPNPWPSGGAVGHWPLEDSFKDASPSMADGQGVGQTQWWPLKPG